MNRRAFAVLSFFVLLFLGLTVYSRIDPLHESLYQSYPELRHLPKGEEDIEQELVHFFERLAVEKGSVYAQNALIAAPLIQNTHVHVLGHVIGDAMYREFGASGIQYCTHHFRNACAHSIIGGVFREFGDDAYTKVVDLCQEAAKDELAYQECFHGVGHYVFLLNQLDFEKSAKWCQESLSSESGRVIAECVGGVAMELAGGGELDAVGIADAQEKYFRNEDVFSPCTESYVTDAGREGCLEYFTIRLRNIAGERYGYDTSDYMFRAIDFCDDLIKDEDVIACSRGFGREFMTYIAPSVDYSIQEEVAIEAIVAGCMRGASLQGQQACIENAGYTILSKGDTSIGNALEFCAKTGNDTVVRSCIDHVISQGNRFADLDVLQDSCEALSIDYRTVCLDRIGNY